MSTVLVVDDEQIICDLLQSVLSTAGYEVFTARGGHQGLSIFRQVRPQFTLLDLRMPDMHGLEVLKEIRKVDPQAAVMVLTSWGNDDLERKARRLGVTDFLSKTITCDAIVAAIERGLQTTGVAPSAKGATAAVTAPSDATAKGELILVVDDDAQIRDLFMQSLTKRGFRVRAASGGPEALELVDSEKPSLIVLDVYMPGMNGIEVLKQLRKKKYKSGVILLTGSQDEKLLKEAWELGVVDIIGKPVDLDKLTLVIHLGLLVKD